MKRFLYILLPLCAFGFAAIADAQGVYTEFGQNRVQQGPLNYSYLQKDEIEVLYTPKGREVADYVLRYTLQELPKIETFLNYRLGGGIKIVAFHNLSEYRQSNMGLSNPQFSAGGYTYIANNTAMVYFNGNHIDLERQVRKAIAEVVINEMIFGGSIQERVRTAALLNLPDWYYKGLVSYLSDNWNIENDNYLKDAYQTGRFKAFTSLENEDVVLAGHSIWRYIEVRFGKGSVADIVFLTRIGRNIENALNFYTGLSIKSLFDECEAYYKNLYEPDEKAFSEPKGSENAPAKISHLRHTQFKISPDGKQLAIVTNQKGQYSIWIYNVNLKTLIKLKKGGYKTLNQTIDYSYPILAWDTKGKKLAVLSDKKGKNEIEEYDLSGKLKKTIPLPEWDWVKEFSYNKEGTEIVVSAIRNGQSDLFLYNIAAKTYKTLTNDIYDNLNPRFTEKEGSILFASNMPLNMNSSNIQTEVLYHNATTNIFLLDIETGIAKPITPDAHNTNYWQPMDMGNGYYTFLSDKNGVVNSYALAYEKAQTPDGADIIPLTNYKRSIIYHDLSTSAGLVADLIFSNGRYKVFVSDITDNPLADAESITYHETQYRKWLDRSNPVAVKKDTSAVKAPPLADSSKADTSRTHPDSIVPPANSLKTTVVPAAPPARYTFQTGFPEIDYEDKLPEESSPKAAQAANARTFEEHPYKYIFGVDYFLTQLDNSILNNYYFMSAVNETVYDQPFLSGLLKTNISDIMRNHTVEAGLRIPSTLNYSEYFFKYTNRLRRVDKEFAVFRKTRLFDDENLITRMYTSQGSYTLQYPFNERSRIQAGILARQDKYVTTSTDSEYLKTPDVGNIYGGVQLQYVYDNTISKGLNLLQGLRFKAFAEYYNGFQKTATIVNLGFDVRNYQKLHRQIILATRLSFNTSPAAQKTAYYLGGVENWLSSKFNKDVPILNTPEYAFQTIAPLRGFNRNARSGSSYVLLSAELRIPIVSYLYQKPIRGEFWRNLMFAPFIDMGTAWVGSSPYDIGNPFNTRLINEPSYTATVISQRNPFLTGVGFGVRSKILGYYVKFDQAWGLSEGEVAKSQQLFSLGLDF